MIVQFGLVDTMIELSPLQEEMLIEILENIYERSLNGDTIEFANELLNALNPN